MSNTVVTARRQKNSMSRNSKHSPVTRVVIPHGVAGVEFELVQGEAIGQYRALVISGAVFTFRRQTTWLTAIHRVGRIATVLG